MIDCIKAEQMRKAQINEEIAFSSDAHWFWKRNIEPEILNILEYPIPGKDICTTLTLPPSYFCGIDRDPLTEMNHIWEFGRSLGYEIRFKGNTYDYNWHNIGHVEISWQNIKV